MIVRHPETVTLWRRRVLADVPRSSRSTDYTKVLFPSARQALTQAVIHLGLSRPDRVAVPEFSSHCIHDSIGRIATPIPMRETLKYGLPVSAVLLYSQWGWPLTPSCVQAVGSHFADAALIVDNVDYTTLAPDPTFENHPAPVMEVFSVAKVLGMDMGGGGLLRSQGRFLPFEPDPVYTGMSERLWRCLEDPQQCHLLEHIHKSNLPCHTPTLADWVRKHDIDACFALEAKARRSNLATVLGHPLAQDWPGWMSRAVDCGATPAVAPLLRGQPVETLRRIRERLLDRLAIKAEVYHFNWTGDVMAPRYEPCLAFPVHAAVQDPGLGLECIAETASNGETT